MSLSQFTTLGILLCFLQQRGVMGDVEPVIDMIPANGELGALVGETASLWCKITQGDPLPTVTWVKGPDNTPVGGEGEELKFDPVKLEDAVGYKCTARNSAGSKTGRFIVKVYESKAKMAFSGDEVKIVNPHGKNGIKLTWYNTNLMAGDSVDDKYKVAEWLVHSNSSANVKPGYDVDDKTGDLLIPSVTLDHDGWYTAFMMDTSLVVYGMPSGVVMDGLPNPVNESVEQTITCTVPVVRPENVKFIWSRSGSLIEGAAQQIINNGDTFKVISTLKYTFLRGMDGEILKCSVGFEQFPDNWVFAEKYINITYIYKVRTVQVDGADLPVRGDDMSLLCSTVKEGKPLSTEYSWYKDDTPLNDGDKYTGTGRQKMTLQNLEVQDAGLYECRLRNDAGYSLTEGYNLEKVLYMPTLKIDCPQVVNETETLEVNCRVIEAEPAVEEDDIRWYYNGTLMVFRGKTLEVKKISRQQKGTYSCDASNKVGTSQRANCPIDVYYPYHVSTEASDPNKLPTKGEDFKLFCKIIDDGNPQGGRYFWYKDGNTHQPLEDGNKYSGTETSELTIKQLEMKDDGEYECQLLNNAGMSDTNKTYHLKVRESIPTYEVLVQPRQSILDVGATLQIFCSIHMDSMKDGVRWRIREKIIYQTYPENYYYDKERYEVHDSGPSNVSIVVKDLKKSDEGSYRCESIAHPTSYKVSDVIIADPVSGPTFEVKITPRQTITELGVSTAIKCTVDLGKNQDSIRWKRLNDEGISKTIFQTYPTDFDYNKDKYSVRIPNSGTVDLTIKNVSSEDGGKYICEPMVHADMGKVAELVIRL